MGASTDRLAGSAAHGGESQRRGIGVRVLQQIRHQVRAISYNRRAILRPRRFGSLIDAWYRSQTAYLRRSHTLARVLEVEVEMVDRLLEESREVMAYCTERSRDYSALWPGLLNPNFGPVLYVVVRALKPDVVVETGVGSGVSSTFILSAIGHSGAGRLYSVDLPSPDQRLLPEARIHRCGAAEGG